MIFMAYRLGERMQATLFPQSVEEYVGKEDPVRVYEAFVEAVDFREIGIEENEHKVGCPQYDPKSMLKLLVYGYSYGVRSSRELERAVYHNVSFIWLMKGLRPDHKTIANFRSHNKEALKQVIKQCAKLCLKFNLIEGNKLFLDSSKIRANASINNTWTEEKINKYTARLEYRIEEIIKESEQLDQKEAGNESLIKLKEELQDKQVMKEKIKEVLEEIREQGIKSLNSVDRDCVKVKGRQGSHAGYSGHIVADEKHGLIVNSDVVNKNNDTGEFSNQIKQANELLGKRCETACADAGYSNVSNLKETDQAGIEVIVPNRKQAGKKVSGEFDKERFKYDVQKDQYICPEGKELTFRGMNNKKGHRNYSITRSSLCKGCKHYGICTKSKYGRRVIRLIDEELKEKLKKQYESKEGQAIYKLRKEKVELPFGHLKRNLKVGAFLLRGLKGVQAEMSILTSCFNIRRMITILGVNPLINKLSA